MNGQSHRRRVLVELLRRWNPTAIVETGTFRGATTEFFAQLSTADVFSCDSNPRYLNYARRRLANYSNIHLHLNDSPVFLASILENLDSSQRVLAYLDAHWEKNLPLWDEMRIITDSPTPTVVIVDDFKVPGDSGYGFDDYGSGKRLDLDSLAPLLPKDWEVWAPSLPSSSETGARRGWVVSCSSSTSEFVGIGDLMRRLEIPSLG